jgi:membrane-associated phospholipid phosphatase
LRDWSFAGGVVALSAIVSPFDDNIDRWAFKHRNDRAFKFLKPVRPGGFLFSGKTITPIALGTLAVAILSKNQSMQQGLLGCATAYAASSAVRTYVIYPLIGRERPEPRDSTGPAPPATRGDQYQLSAPGSSNWGMHSLPGGHLSNLAACGASLTWRYSLGPFAPAVWALVGGVGLARTLDRAHWASDELLGLGLGAAVGREVALRSLRRMSDAAPHSSNADRGSFELFTSVTRTSARVGTSRRSDVLPSSYSLGLMARRLGEMQRFLVLLEQPFISMRLDHERSQSAHRARAATAHGGIEHRGRAGPNSGH